MPRDEWKMHKARHPEKLLLFATPGFYELHHEDALIVAELLHTPRMFFNTDPTTLFPRL